MAYSTDSTSKASSPPKKSSGKMTDKQKADLKKHMATHSKDMSPSEQKSHRMAMMSRMRRGMSVRASHKDIVGK